MRCDICSNPSQNSNMLCSACRETISRLARIYPSGDGITGELPTVESVKGKSSRPRANWWNEAGFRSV